MTLVSVAVIHGGDLPSARVRIGPRLRRFIALAAIREAIGRLGPGPAEPVIIREGLEAYG